MDKDGLKKLINECINEVLTDQNFESASDGISNSSFIGKSWKTLVSELGRIHSEMKDFEGVYRTAIIKSGKPANINYSIQKIEQILSILQEIKPTVYTMDRIQNEDRYN